MADQKTGNREKVKEIVASIEGGIKDLFQSEQYAQYLSTMSRFHNYSYRNTLLIHMQRPDATLVAGFNKWKNQFGRHVKKGEKGITILAPTPFKKKIEEQKLDPDTRAPVLDADGNIVTEEREIQIPMFRPVKVFDVKQTDGKPLPSLAMDLTGDVRHYKAFLDALCRASPVPVDFKPIKDSMDGYFSLENQRITIRDNMSETQTVCALVHEITHATLHNRERDQRATAAGETEPAKKKDENTMEVEAESVSYAVCQYYGIETSANSLAYIATWSSGRELPELKASLETISKTANALITSIDRHFTEICKERGIVLEQTEQGAPDAETPADTPVPSETKPKEEYLYSSEINPQHVGESDRRRIRARKLSDQGMTPEQIIFVGSNELCDKVLTHLSTGRLHHDDFFTVSSAIVSRYTMKDGTELDAFTGPDDKVYLGRRDHYDNRGHYMNHDKTLLHVSDNPNMFRFLSGASYTETQSELLEEEYFTQEDYAEFAAMQMDVLTQFEQREPLLFAGEPFRFPIADAPERKEAPSVAEQTEGLFLVDNSAYLHIQKGDGVYDYTIYDKETMRQLDGGQFTVLSATGNFSVSLREHAAGLFRDGVPDVDLEGDTVEEAPLELVETLQDAAMREMREAASRMKSGQEPEVLPDGDTRLDEYPMPDPAYSRADMDRDFAYLEGYLLPVSKDKAEEFMERDFSVYAIVNEYANMVFDREELDALPSDTICSISTEEWEASPDFRQAVADRLNHQEEREAAFLNYVGDCFAIYQMPLNEETRFLRFEPLERLRENGLAVDRTKYNLVYTAPLHDAASVDAALEELWENHPADYRRPSMSVSDIVAIRMDGVLSCHYCDDVGFVKLPDFIQPENYLKTAELSSEDDCNMIDGIINNGPKQPTVAELEAQAKSGQTISLTDLYDAIQREQREKKSVIAQLKGKSEPERPKKAPKKSRKKER